MRQFHLYRIPSKNSRNSQDFRIENSKLNLESRIWNPTHRPLLGLQFLMMRFDWNRQAPCVAATRSVQCNLHYAPGKLLANSISFACVLLFLSTESEQRLSSKCHFFLAPFNWQRPSNLTFSEVSATLHLLHTRRP